MSWKIKTDPETPYLFTPGGSGAGGHMVPFDQEGLVSGGWWVSGPCDLGPAPRTKKFWWQAKTALSSPQSPGSFVSYYASTMDDNDLSNLDGFSTASGILPPSGNYLATDQSSGEAGLIPNSACPDGVPKVLAAEVSGIGCNCLNGNFTLTWNDTYQVWLGSPILCSGATEAVYPFFACDASQAGFGFDVIEDGHIDEVAVSVGTVLSCSSFSAQDSNQGWDVLRVLTWCNNLGFVHWTVSGTGVATPLVSDNLHYIGSVATDGTGGSGVPNVTSGYLEVESRYLYVVAYNGTPEDLSPLASDHHFYLLPVPDEVQ
jgi:hypothetical protein